MKKEQNEKKSSHNQPESKNIGKFEPSMIYETSREIIDSIDSKEVRDVLVKKYSSFINFK